jgi:hypothetical protein
MKLTRPMFEMWQTSPKEIGSKVEDNKLCTPCEGIKKRSESKFLISIKWKFIRFLCFWVW